MLTRDSEANPFPSSLWRDMQRLQNEMNQVFAGASRPNPRFPAFNLWRNAESAILTTELPGVNLEDLDITVTGDVLTIQGRRLSDTTPDNTGVTYHRRERSTAAFSRVVQLPFHVEPGDVSAEFKNGVLAITLPQAQAERPRKIQVKTV